MDHNGKNVCSVYLGNISKKMAAIQALGQSQVYSYYDPRLTMTYFTPWSNLVMEEMGLIEHERDRLKILKQMDTVVRGFC